MDTASFKLSYSALKMFGKQLYSNVGSAISELVANGLDAGAENIYVVIDARNKNNATVEILDNGSGMTNKHIKEKYVTIGHNKRNDFLNNSSKVMGRKGIGKLAALYLSDKFTIITKTKGSTPSVWMLDVTDMEDDNTPELEKIDNFDFSKLLCKDNWNRQKNGTLVFIENVDMKGFGKRGLESLERKMSNYFLDNDKINFNLILKDEDIGKFKKINKQIAYNNMVCIFTDDLNNISIFKPSKFRIEYKDKLKNKHTYEQITEVIDFEEIGESFSVFGEQEFFGKRKHYCLTGWVGVHSTIDENDAKQNDERYFKGTYYNPNQLRLYVRRKLAVANMLDYLGIARAFANYIEGEVSFDILDDDDLPDIATAGRQDFDSTDPRFVLLIDILRVIGNALVGKRQALANQLKDKKKNTNDNILNKAKERFAHNFEKNVSQLDISKDVANQLITTTVNQIEGDIEAKAKYTLFISHASCDRFLSDFFFYYLKSLGFNGNLRNIDECEIFYSSSGMDTNISETLSDRIKNFLISSNNDVLILASKGFKKSEFCMFEGGAIWATKAVSDCKIVAIDYSEIPTFLKNGSPEVSFSATDFSSYKLTREKYNDIVDVLSKLIKHLNQNFLIRNTEPACIPVHIDFPDDVMLKKQGKTIYDYMDSKIVEYWNTYVINHVKKYLGQNMDKDSETQTV